MFERLGHFVFRNRRAVILAWLIIIILCAFAAPKVSSKLAHGAVMPTQGEAADGYNIIGQELGIKSSSHVVVFTSETLRADDVQFMDEVDASLAGLRDIPNLDPPVTYRSCGDFNLISGDGRTTYAVIAVDGDAYESCRLVPIIREKMSPQPNLSAIVTGDAAFRHDAEAIAMDDMARVEKYTFALIAIVLVLIFGSLVAAGLPLAIGAASVVLTMGLVFLLSAYLDITSSSLTVIAFLGLGSGVDYALIMVTRFREELAAGRGVEDSVVVTSSTSGQAIFFSAGTSVIGLGALITFDNPLLRSLGIGGAIVIALALAAGLTLLPALLATLGLRVNRLAVFRLAEQRGVFWERLARWQMKHAMVVLAVLVPCIVLLIWPLAHINPSNISYTSLPSCAPARQGYEMLSEGFGAGEVAPIMVCVTANSEITDWDNIAGLYHLTRMIALHEDVSRVESIVNLDPQITREQYELMYALPDSIPDPRIEAALSQLANGHTTLVRVYTNQDPMSEEGRALVRSIRDMRTGGLEIYVTGPTASDVDMVNQLFRGFLWALLIIVGASYVALFCLFRSVLLPLKAIVLNVASVAATFGILIFIFQQGHFANVLGFTPDGTLNVLAGIIVFCIVFGLSMDYEVFLLTRIREAWEETQDNTAAVAFGLQRTGRVITSSALLMVVIFGSFALSSLVLLKIVGLGLAISILLDATIIRLFLAPAMMRVMGRWNWWAPSFLKHFWRENKRDH